MISFDTETENTVAALEVGAARAKAASDLARASSDALAQRLSVFSTELDVAKERLSTAKSDKAAADAVEKSIDDSLLEALKATRQALIIYASARNTLQLAEKAAQQAVVAGSLVSETLSRVTTASKQNSFISRKLQADAEQADADASAAVDAAVSALEDATDAFIATERAAGASFLVVASLIDLQSLMSGYTKPAGSSENELPSALSRVQPLVLAGIPQLPSPPARITPKDVRSFDGFLLQQTPELFSGEDKLDQSPFSDLPGNADLLEFTVARYMGTMDKSRDEKVKALAGSKTLPEVLGLQPGFEQVHETAQAYETEMQHATTLTQQAATEASQALTRKTARLQTAQHALAAARQAAGA